MIKGAQHAVSFSLLQYGLGVESLEGFRASHATVSIYIQLHHGKVCRGQAVEFSFEYAIDL